MPGIPDRKKAIGLVPISSPTDARVYPTGTYVIPPGTDGYALVSDSTSPTGFGWSSTGGGGSPTGPAGGDLAGNYPDPTLKTITSAATSGSSTAIPVITVDAKGRVTAITTASPTLSGDAGGDLTGSYPNPTLVTVPVSTGSYGSTSETVLITVDSKGRVTSAAETSILLSQGQVLGLNDISSSVANVSSSYYALSSSLNTAGGDLTGSYPNPTLVNFGGGAVTEGAASKTLTISVDAKGRVSSISDQDILVSQTQVTGLTDLSSSFTNVSSSYNSLSGSFVILSGTVGSVSSSYYTLSSSLNTAGGDLTGSYPNPTLKEITTATTKGTADKSVTVQVDAKGRITSLTEQSILIDGDHVTGFTSLSSSYYSLSSSYNSLSGSFVIVSGTVDSLSGLYYPLSSSFASLSSSAIYSGSLAGGDLTGSYPNPTLKEITTAATSGSSTAIPIITVDAKGRITSMSTAAPSLTGLAGGDLTGSYPDPTLVNFGGGAATKGSASKSATITVDAKGRVSALSDQDISIAQSQVSGLTELSSSFVSVSGTVGSLSGSYYPLSSSYVVLSSSVIYSGSLANGDLTGTYPGPTLKEITTAGTSGSATVVPVVTIDAKGRVTTLSSSAIQIAESQVTNLTTDLSGKVSKTGDTMTGTLTQSVSIDFPLIVKPTAAVATAVSGGAVSVPSVGSRVYYVTYYTSNGETNYGAASNGVIPAGSAATSSVVLTIPTSSDSRVVGRKIYVTLAANNSFSYNVGTVTNNTATSFTHSTADPGTYTDTTNRDNNTNKFLTVDGANSMFLGDSSTVYGVNAALGIAGNTSFGGANTAIGSYAMYLLTTGYKNAAVGRSSLVRITTGYENTSVGNESGIWMTSSFQNTFMGAFSGQYCRGSNNTGIGWGSLRAGSQYKYDHNTAIGNGSLYYIQTGYQNIGVGSWAGNNITTGYNNIIVGVGVYAPLSGGAGQLNIGNVIYGSGMYGNPNSFSSVPTSNGKVGIGLTTPTAVLHLKAGTTAATTAPLKFESGSLMTVAETGSIEFDGDKIYLTITSSTARKEFTLNDGVNSANLVPYTTTNGRLTSSFMQVNASNKILTVNGSLNVTGAVSFSGIKTITTSSYTVLSTDTTILANAASNAITINLPAVASNVGRILVFKKIDSSVNNVTLDGNGAETIDGSTTKNLGTQYQARILQSDGSAWYIIGNF